MDRNEQDAERRTAEDRDLLDRSWDRFVDELARYLAENGNRLGDVTELGKAVVGRMQWTEEEMEALDRRHRPKGE